MDADEFKKRFGRDHEQDDLDRANCRLAGKLGHLGCGVCVEHGRLVFECEQCSVRLSHGEKIELEESMKNISVQIDNRLVYMVKVPQEEYQSNTVVYHELNENWQPIAEHSFPFPEALLENTGSFFINGHHYKTGDKVCEYCECDVCTIRINKGIVNET